MVLALALQCNFRVRVGLQVFNFKFEVGYFKLVLCGSLAGQVRSTQAVPTLLGEHGLSITTVTHPKRHSTQLIYRCRVGLVASASQGRRLVCGSMPCIGAIPEERSVSGVLPWVVCSAENFTVG